MNTLFVLLAIVVLLRGAARFKQIYPHRPLIVVGLVPGLLSIGLLTTPALFWPLMILDGLLLTFVLADLLTLPRRTDFAAERRTGRIASLRKPHEVTLTISNQGRHDRAVWIRDGAEQELRPDPDEFTVVLPARSRSTLSYNLRAERRGSFVLDQVFLRVRSRFGLWQRYLDYPVRSEIRVYPDMKQLGEYAVMARTNRLSLMGVRRTRKIGQDNEFERLRDYTLDDNYKHIDWRSTARRNKLTVRDFQANQSQRVIFLLDCGRMMTSEASGVTLLDHALNAMLMLGYVALRQGDQVGILPFSDRVHGYVPPRGGLGQMNHLLHNSYDRRPQMVESRYDEAFLYLASHCHKRALVVLVTNVIDEVNAHQVRQYLGSLVGRHLPLGILLRDHRLFDAVEAPEASISASDQSRLYRAAAAADVLTWRHHVLTDLARKGVLMLDVFPEDMTAPLVNQYLDIKARHLL